MGNRGDKDGFTADDSLQRQVSAVSVTLLLALSTEWIKLFSRRTQEAERSSLISQGQSKDI